MDEDQSRARTDHAPENLARRRRFARNLLRANPDHGSTRGKIKRAGCDDAFLLKILANAECDCLGSSLEASRHTTAYALCVEPIHKRRITMRTNIDIDDALMRGALAATGLRTKRAVVEEALRLLIRLKGQERLKELAGKVQWEGDLDEMRRKRFPDWS
jgi:Arc/MetJ family transcription regulator